MNVANTLPSATFTHDPPSPNPRDVGDPDVDVARPGRQASPTVEWDTDNDGAFDDGTGREGHQGLPHVRQPDRAPAGDRRRRRPVDRLADHRDRQPPADRRRSTSARPRPVAGQLVTLFSTADDPDKNIESDRLGPRRRRHVRGRRQHAPAATFPAGSFNVSMRVTDTEGSFAIVTQDDRGRRARAGAADRRSTACAR